MTTKELSKLTPEQKRVMIAEACGFCFTSSELSGGVEEWHDCDGEIVHTLPDYLNDLNAMHEAEKVLESENGELWELYCKNLLLVVGRVEPFKFADFLWAIDATAAQRADAFLLTIGQKARVE